MTEMTTSTSIDTLEGLLRQFREAGRPGINDKDRYDRRKILLDAKKGLPQVHYELFLRKLVGYDDVAVYNAFAALKDKKGLSAVGQLVLESNPELAYVAFRRSRDEAGLSAARVKFIDDNAARAYVVFRRFRDDEGVAAARPKYVKLNPTGAYQSFTIGPQGRERDLFLYAGEKGYDVFDVPDKEGLRILSAWAAGASGDAAEKLRQLLS